MGMLGVLFLSDETYPRPWLSVISMLKVASGPSEQI